MVIRIVRPVLLDVLLVLPNSLLEGVGREARVGLHGVVPFIGHHSTVDHVADGAGVGEGTSVLLSSSAVAGWGRGLHCATQDFLVMSGDFSTHILQGPVRDLDGVCVHNWSQNIVLRESSDDLQELLAYVGLNV